MRKPVLLGVLALALSVTLALFGGAAGAAKKKGKSKKAAPVSITSAVNLPIIDESPVAPGIDGITRTAINVGNQFKGLKVRDVNVTLQVVGTVSGGGADPVDDINIRLQAPNGAVSGLFSEQGEGNLLGPVTFDDETPVSGIDAGPPDGDTTVIFAPYQGSVQPQGHPLNTLDNGGVPGAWTLVIRDDNDGNTLTLTSWTLNVITGRPFLTK